MQTHFLLLLGQSIFYIFNRSNIKRKVKEPKGKGNPFLFKLMSTAVKTILQNFKHFLYVHLLFFIESLFFNFGLLITQTFTFYDYNFSF